MWLRFILGDIEENVNGCFYEHGVYFAKEMHKYRTQQQITIPRLRLKYQNHFADLRPNWPVTFPANKHRNTFPIYVFKT